MGKHAEEQQELADLKKKYAEELSEVQQELADQKKKHAEKLDEVQQELADLRKKACTEATDPTSSEPIVGSKVIAKGLEGEVTQHDAEDPNMTYKVLFADGKSD